MELAERLTRRGLLRLGSLGALMAPLGQAGWLESLAHSAGPKPKKSIIVLWLNGGPATIDLWDLKPGHKNGGPFQEAKTSIPGFRISEHLSGLACRANDIALIRSVSTKEGDHERAIHLLRTGYIPQAAIQFPPLGSLVAKELGTGASALPDFVSIGLGRGGSAMGGGFLGPRFAPLSVNADQDGSGVPAVPDLDGPGRVDQGAMSRRVDMLLAFNRAFESERPGAVGQSMSDAALRADRLMQPEAKAAFRIGEESPKTRSLYGKSFFGQGCLLARRLVERGVPYVEVGLDGWDTHNDNFSQVKNLSRILDAGFSALLCDLKERGLLDSTLVVCQGEFGRTPVINGSVGRDHWPHSWAVALAGGGLKTGRIIGKTSADGTQVEEQRTTIPDLVATIAQAIGIDPAKRNPSNVGRPIRIADPVARPIEELL